MPGGHVRVVAALAFFACVLCTDTESSIAPETHATLDGDVEPPQPTAEPSSPLNAASVAEAAEAAQRALQALMDSYRFTEPSELLTEAAAYRTGSDGRRKRPAQAIVLLQAVAGAANLQSVSRENSTRAELELGHMHLRAEGVEQDTQLAIAHYMRAAEEGDPAAQEALGVLYSTGFGVERDAPLATTFLHFAAEGGSVGAQLISAPRARGRCERAT